VNASFATYDELRAAIGREVAVSDWVPVTQAQIDGFAAVTGAGHAPGLFLLSLWPRIGYGLLTLPEAALSVNYGLDKARFGGPVRAGQRVRARLAPAAVEDVPGGVQIHWRVTLEVEGVADPACIAETISRRYARPT
jgi:acyl dehydratase